MASIRTSYLPLSLDVDLMILHYIVHDATNALLARLQQHQQESQGEKSQVSKDDFLPKPLENQLHLVDSFISLFRLRHPDYSPTIDVTSRLALLRFTLLFTLRSKCNSSTPSETRLANISLQNRERANAWQKRGYMLERAATENLSTSEANSGNESFSFLKSASEKFFDSLEHTSSDTEKNRQDGKPVLLIQLVPKFIEMIWLCTLRIRLSQDIDSHIGASGEGQERTQKANNFTSMEQTMGLVAFLMSHAVIESYLHGDGMSSNITAWPLLEAFSWGPWSHATLAEEQYLVNTGSETHFDGLFLKKWRVRQDNNSTKSAGSDGKRWLRFRMACMMRFLPSDPAIKNTVDYLKYLTHLTDSDFSALSHLDRQMHRFLSDLQHSFEPPSLAVLDGLTREPAATTHATDMVPEDHTLTIEGMNLSPEETRRLVGIWRHASSQWLTSEPP